jgi:hypothetical protein
MEAEAGASDRLRELLGESQLREGEFRLRAARDALEAAARIDELSRTLADRDRRVHELNLAAAERDRYVHELHLAQNFLRGEIARLHADLEEFTWMLEASAPGRSGTGSADLPGAPFTYHLATSPFRIYRGGPVTLRGWALPRGGERVAAIRARVDERAFEGAWGLEEPEAAGHGAQAANPRPGFEITVEVPPGRHRLRLEANLDPGGWVSILNLPVWCRPG